jgi:jumonji domain-containing protein 7
MVSPRFLPQHDAHYTHHLLHEWIYTIERTYPHATYTRHSPTSALVLTPSPDAPSIRWSSIPNPNLLDTLPPEAHPIHISLKAGETLYLPAGWWHHVRQGREEDEIGGERGEQIKEEKTIAVNWWYDFEGRGMGWVWLGFFRGGDVPDGNT